MANHSKEWDAKLLAYVLLKRNRVAGLPGVYPPPLGEEQTRGHIRRKDVPMPNVPIACLWLLAWLMVALTPSRPPPFP
jgi:hypothetical protein